MSSLVGILQCRRSHSKLVVLAVYQHDRTMFAAFVQWLYKQMSLCRKTPVR